MSKFTTDKCLITGLDAQAYPEALVNGWSYYIKTLGDNNQLIILDESFKRWQKNKFYEDNKHVIAGAIINNKLFENNEPSSFGISIQFLMQRLPQLSYPKTPKEKIDNLLGTLVRQQNYEGETKLILDLMNSPFMYYGHYFRSKEECNFYMKTLFEKGLIRARFQEDTGTIVDYSLSHSGLEYYLDLTERGNLSNNCFVAMSFSDSTKSIREAIRTAVKETGFIPIFIDEQNIESSQTINDAIIVELKKSKFCIADFTEQKDGVYFECGYALGQGSPVIYACHSDWFDKTHFDTKHFSHIIYSTPEELENRLKNKINAWIK